MVEHGVLDLHLEAHLVLLTAFGAIGQVGVPAVGVPRVNQEQDE